MIYGGGEGLLVTVKIVCVCVIYLDVSENVKDLIFQSVLYSQVSLFTTWSLGFSVLGSMTCLGMFDLFNSRPT